MSLINALYNLQVSASFSNDLGGLAPNIFQQLQLALGTSAGQVNLVHGKKYTIVNNATPQSLDLAGGILLDPELNPITFAKMKVMAFVNKSTTQVVTVGGGSNPFLGPWGANSVTIGKSGVEIFASPLDGWGVTAGTGDILKLQTDSGANNDVVVLLLGTDS
jgi:hypothetical protein